MKLICIKCPRGCELSIDGNAITGNQCPRGLEYANEELTSPKRVVTALIKTKNGIAPVKSNREVPKDKIFDVIKEINKLKIDDAKIGDIVISNCLGLNVDIVVTGDVYNK